MLIWSTAKPQSQLGGSRQSLPCALRLVPMCSALQTFWEHWNIFDKALWSTGEARRLWWGCSWCGWLTETVQGCLTAAVWAGAGDGSKGTERDLCNYLLQELSRVREVIKERKILEFPLPCLAMAWIWALLGYFDIMLCCRNTNGPVQSAWASDFSHVKKGPNKCPVGVVKVLGSQVWLVSAKLSLLSSSLCFSPLASADHLNDT